MGTYIYIYCVKKTKALGPFVRVSNYITNHCIISEVKAFRTILIYVFTVSSSQQFCTTAYILVPQVHNVYIFQHSRSGPLPKKKHTTTQGSNVKRSPMATWQDPGKWESYNSLGEATLLFSSSAAEHPGRETRTTLRYRFLNCLYFFMF